MKFLVSRLRNDGTVPTVGMLDRTIFSQYKSLKTALRYSGMLRWARASEYFSKHGNTRIEVEMYSDSILGELLSKEVIYVHPNNYTL